MLHDNRYRSRSPQATYYNLTYFSSRKKKRIRFEEISVVRNLMRRVCEIVEHHISFLSKTEKDKGWEVPSGKIGARIV